MNREGDEAAKWLLERKIIAGNDARVSADELKVDEWRILRTWHTAARGGFTPSGQSFLLVLQLEGSMMCSVPANSPPEKIHALELGAGDTLLIPPGAEVAFVAGRPTARVEVELRPTGAMTSHTVGWNLASKRTERSWTAPAVVSLVNSALNASLTPLDAQFDLFADALRSCFYAEAQRMTHPSSPRRLTGDALVREIERSIERHASDPEFSVDLLAKSLGFTPRHIVNVLAAKGLPSPGKLIRAQRLRTAFELLEEYAVSETRITMDELAQWSGFGSRTSLRRALEAQGPPKRTRVGM